MKNKTKKVATNRTLAGKKFGKNFDFDLIKPAEQNELLRPFMPSIDHFRTSLFKTSCLCHLDSRKSCIFCHVFKKSKKSEPIVEMETRRADQVHSSKMDADENHVNFYHSYSKKTAKHLSNATQTDPNRFDLNDLNIDFDDGLLDNLVNERLSSLFESNQQPKKIDFEFGDENNFLEPGKEICQNEIDQLPNFTYEE